MERKIEDLEIFRIHADFCNAFSNEKRLRILWLLSEKECSVGELAKKLGITTPNVSQHLRIMKDRGAVIERKEGQQVYYRIASKKIIEGYKKIREGLIEILETKSKIFSS